MRISDILHNRCRLRTAHHKSRTGSKGYTLLEILMVISLIGLMAGLAMPRLTTIYNSVQWANERDDVLRRISELGFSAFREGRAFELKHYPGSEDSEKLPLELPAGWTIEANSAIRYKANGVCLGGRMRLNYGERSLMVHLYPPHGRAVMMKD